MGARAEITARYARAYRKASKRDRGRLLDEVVAVTGWSRDNESTTHGAMRAVIAALGDHLVSQ